VVYDADTRPWIIVECKEMNVPLDKAVLEQVLRYNISLNVPYFAITNGSYCLAFSANKNVLTVIENLPAF
jgi:hypothetical protein